MNPMFNYWKVYVATPNGGWEFLKGTYCITRSNEPLAEVEQQWDVTELASDVVGTYRICIGRQVIPEREVRA